MASLEVEIAGIRLKNPVMPASGAYEYSEERESFFSPGELGAIINKTIFLEKRIGNPPPRIVETPCGMLNAIGIPTGGIEDFIETQLPKMEKFGVPIIASVAGNSIEDFVSVSERVAETGKVSFIELNLSCPNLSEGIEWARDRKQLSNVIERVKASVDIPIIAKLSPMVSDITEMAAVSEDAGADAVALINTYKGMVIDIDRKKPLLGNLTGGLSGPAIHPLAVFAVFSSYRKIKIPIIGIGGIASWSDAVEMILAGATAVGIGMYNFVNPMVMKEVIEGISNYLDANGFNGVKEIVGFAHRSG